MSDTIETETGDNKVVNLFANGVGDNWVETVHVKSDDQRCPPDDVLSAQLGQLQNVVLIGQTEAGGFVLASSLRRLSDVNYLIDGAKWHMTGFSIE